VAPDRYVRGGGEASRSAASSQMQATIGQPAARYTIAVPLAVLWGYWGSLPYATYLPLLLR
jgi:hypothetical protein